MLRRENILITEDYMSKTTSATHFTAPVEIECFDSSIHFGKESDRVEIQNCNIKNNVLVHCSKDDTYDFETGALIALMKMCGSDKVVRACNEAFSYETDIKVLRKDNNLREANKGLQEEVKRLKGESESHWKKYQRNIQKKQDRINELNNIEEEYIKLREEYDSLFEEKEKLQHEYNLCLNSENALRYTVDSLNKSVDKLSHSIDGYKNDLYKVAKRCKELEEENEKLKLDCEKLQHGYNDMIFCGGRQNGKQYTFLVDLFKKLDQKKVDAVYKEAYDKWIAQPIWQKEVFKQIHKDQLASLLEAGKCLYKNLTKREKMWDDILKEGRTPVYVKREDIHEFLKECQATGIKWTTGKMPLETMPFHMSKGYDGIYFFVMTSLDISKSTSGSKEYRHVMCWWMTASDEEARNSIKYIPPMRWDLFKKGRLAVKVNYDNYKEFYEKCEAVMGKKPMTLYTGEYTVSICKKDGLFEIFTIEDQKKTGRKIVDWESVKPAGTPIKMEDPYDTWSL